VSTPQPYVGQRATVGMDVTTSGRYRVLGRPRRDDAYVLVDVGDDYEPVTVEAASAPDLTAGWLIEATLAWDDGTARIGSWKPIRRTEYHFYDGVTGMFEAARRAWEATAERGEAMGSTVTRDTDGEPAGALYVFAEQRGARDLYEELRTGTTPIEPLVERVNEGREGGERAVFVMDPADEAFVCVYVVFDRDGVLARTVRDTYDLGAGLAAGLDASDPDDGDPLDEDDDFDALDRL